MTGTPSSGAAGTHAFAARTAPPRIAGSAAPARHWNPRGLCCRASNPQHAQAPIATAHAGVVWTLCGSRPTSLPTRARCPTQQNTAVRCTHATAAPLFDSPMTTHSSLLAFALGFGFRAVPTCSTALFLFAGPVAVNVARAFFRHNHRLTVFRAAVQAVHVDQVVSTGVRRPCATRASPHTAHSR